MIYSLYKILLMAHISLPHLFESPLILLTFFLLFAKILAYGAIAQLIRALPLQGRGPGFESLLLHHFSDKISHGVFSVPPLDTPPTKDPKGLFSCFYLYPSLYSFSRPPETFLFLHNTSSRIIVFISHPTKSRYF